MLKQLLSIFTVSCLLSCSNNNKDVNIQKGIRTDTAAKATVVLFSNPQVIDSSHIVIYPLILEKTSYGSGFSSGGGERMSFWNFYNTDNNTQYLLTDDKRIVIYSININGNSSSSSSDAWSEGINVYENNIFYDVVSKDFNQNNYLDIDDRHIYMFPTKKEIILSN